MTDWREAPVPKITPEMIRAAEMAIRNADEEDLKYLLKAFSEKTSAYSLEQMQMHDLIWFPGVAKSLFKCLQSASDINQAPQATAPADAATAIAQVSGPGMVNPALCTTQMHATGCARTQGYYRSKNKGPTFATQETTPANTESPNKTK